MKNFSNWVIFSFVTLAIIVSIVSTIHSINFFKLTNSENMATTLAIAFELGQLASLAAIVNSNKINPRISWSLFVFLTIFQIMNNIFHSFEFLSANPNSYKNWIDLFGLNSMSESVKKRVLSFISGGFLPLLSIGFSKALVNYLRSLENEKILNDEKFKETETDKIETKIESEVKTEIETKVQIEEKPKIETEKKLEIETKVQIEEKPKIETEPQIQNFSENDSYVLQIEEPVFITRIRKASFMSAEFALKLKAELGGTVDFNEPQFKEKLKQKLIENTEFKNFVVKKLKELDK